MRTNQPRTDLSSGALWASAFVISALILVQASRDGGTRARAEMVSTTGEYTVMTTSAGNDEILVVLDNRNEQLFVYRVENQRSIQLHADEDLREIFSTARAQVLGAP